MLKEKYCYEIPYIVFSEHLLLMLHFLSNSVAAALTTLKKILELDLLKKEQ